MTHRGFRKCSRLVPLLFLLLAWTGCKKRPPAVAATPPPARPAVSAPDVVAAPSPTVEIRATPSTIERGQQATLSWRADHASAVVIDAGVGNVAEQGSLVISPRESTTYTATARGPGGEARASTRVTVVEPRPAVLAPTEADLVEEAIRQGKIQDVFFDYDKAEIKPEYQKILEENAAWFRRYPNVKIVIEGHCDERGTEEYNLALGDRRALAVRDYLVRLGVAPEQLETISFGEERPFDPGHNEAAWAKNRRAHFVVRR